MSVTVDNTGQSATGLSSTTVTIGSFVVGAGANRVIYLAVSQWKASDLQPTAVFNTSENFVAHDSVTIAEAGGTRRVTLFKLVNPTVTTANIVVTWGVAVDEAVAGATSWNTVDQTTPFGTAVKNSGTAGSSSINLTGAVGDVNHCAISADAATVVGITANQTQRWRAIAGTSTTEGAGQSSSGTGANVAHGWTNIDGGAGTATFAHIGVAIQQAASTGGGWVGSGSRRAPAKAGPFDQRGMLLSPYQRYNFSESAAVVGAASTLQRKTLSPLGTHTGGRQSQ